MNAELFYVLDLGDVLAAPLSKVLQPMLASAVGHLFSFALNGALWIGLVAAAVQII